MRHKTENMEVRDSESHDSRFRISDSVPLTHLHVAFKAFCRILDTMKAIEWSADCLVLGSSISTAIAEVGPELVVVAGAWNSFTSASAGFRAIPKGPRDSFVGNQHQ